MSHGDQFEGIDLPVVHVSFRRIISYYPVGQNDLCLLVWMLLSALAVMLTSSLSVNQPLFPRKILAV